MAPEAPARVVARWAALVVLAAPACSASDRSLQEGDAGDDGCGPLMFRSGAICIDQRPALLADGSQAPALSWDAASAACATRGARLCTEAEREAACPGGPEPSNGANYTFCNGPADTWEWSSAACSSAGHCRSPCCNGGSASGYACNYDACDQTTPAASYHCCRTWP